VLRQVDLVSVVVARIAALVHESARGGPDEQLRHERFLLTRLTAGFIALACLPPYLVWRGPPAPLEFMAILCLAAPVPAAILLSKTGWFTAAQRLSAAALAALVLYAAATSVGWASPALLWLAVPAVVGHAAALGLVHMRSEDGQRTARHSREARDHSLAAVVSDLVTWHDPNGHVLEASGDASLFGVPPGALRGRGLFSRVHISDRPAFLKAISDATTSDQPVVVQFRIHIADQAVRPEPDVSDRNFQGASDARVIWGEMRVKRVDAVGQDEPCAVAVTRDISAAARHREELEAARAEAEHMGTAKGQFLAMVSHELRTPLNAIIGFSEVLAGETGAAVEPERRQEYLHIIRNSGEHLLQVVNTLLDMSRIEAGKFDVVPEPFEIASFTHGCCDLMGLKAEQAGILLARDIAPDLPELVADRRACKQMLINLLSNAIKFTPPGGRVTVAARREVDRIVFVVADTGIGVAESDLPKLGDPFFQARSAYDRRHEGTGLGLSVVRGLVGLHRGSLAIESGPDEGTSVTVSLPIDCRTGSSRTTGPVRIHTLARPRSPGRALKVG
jgi:two-component system, cell cycle sensor histidine kinase DivJ